MSDTVRYTVVARYRNGTETVSNARSLPEAMNFARKQSKEKRVEAATVMEGDKPSFQYSDGALFMPK